MLVLILNCLCGNKQVGTAGAVGLGCREQSPAGCPHALCWPSKPVNKPLLHVIKEALADYAAAVLVFLSVQVSSIYPINSRELWGQWCSWGLSFSWLLTCGCYLPCYCPGEVSPSSTQQCTHSAPDL